MARLGVIARMRVRGRLGLGVIAIASACGSKPPDGLDGAEDDTSTGAVVPTDGGDATLPGTASTDGPTADGTGPIPGGYEDDGGGTGCAFTCPPPPPPPTPPGGTGAFECDLVDQDCPKGEKCMPWSTNGGQWNATRCSPIADDPGQAGDRCSAQGSATSGIDSCDHGLVCWQINAGSLMGTCGEVCGMLEPELPCPDGQVCIDQLGPVALCGTLCDPFAAACPVGQGCLPGDAGFMCQIMYPIGLPTGSPCTSVNACEAGLLCAVGPLYTCGDPGEGCCAQICDLDDPVLCPGGGTCLPWFSTVPPPELANLGTCTPPAG